MARNLRTEKVSPLFSAYLSNAQSRLKTATGKKFSRADITAMIAIQQPIIKIEQNGKKKKGGTIFDF